MEVHALNLQLKELFGCQKDFSKAHGMLVHIERSVAAYIDSHDEFDEQLLHILEELIGLLMWYFTMPSIEVQRLNLKPSILSIGKSFYSCFLDQYFLGRRSMFMTQLKSCCASLSFHNKINLFLTPHIIDVLLQMKYFDKLLHQETMVKELRQFLILLLSHPTLFSEPEDTVRGLALLSAIREFDKTGIVKSSEFTEFIPSYELGQWVQKKSPSWLKDVPPKILLDRSNALSLAEFLITHKDSSDLCDLLMESESQDFVVEQEVVEYSSSPSLETDYSNIDEEEEVDMDVDMTSHDKIPKTKPAFEIISGFDDLDASSTNESSPSVSDSEEDNARDFTVIS